MNIQEPYFLTHSSVVTEKVMDAAMPPDPIQNRISSILRSIEEARISLKNWNDQRASALISLDAFAYDLKMVEREKQAILEEYNSSKEYFDRERNEMMDEHRLLQDQYRAREDDLIAKIENLSNQNQFFKLEQERLNQELKDLNVALQASSAEVQKRVEETQALRVQVQEYETKIAESEERERNMRIRESEIDAFLKRMGAPANAEHKTKQDRILAKSMTEEAIQNRNRAMQMAEQALGGSSDQAISGAIANAPENLDDYLKRLGY